MSNVKVIRGQLRIIAKDILPEVLNEEIQKAQYAKLQRDVEAKMRLIEADVKQTLARIDERAKDLQMFMMRQLANNVSLPSEAPKGEDSNGKEPKDIA